MNYHPKHQELVNVFTRIINEVYTPNDLAEINKRNEADGMSSDVCHTHDFGDANESMLQAFAEVFGREALEVSDDESNLKEIESEVEIMNNAWDHAKQLKFSMAPQINNNNMTKLISAEEARTLVAGSPERKEKLIESINSEIKSQAAGGLGWAHFPSNLGPEEEKILSEELQAAGYQINDTHPRITW